MNERFFKLPEEKQQTILNAGFHVFSRNEYRKSPMSEIADAAHISKSLLFHYFHNKKDLYLFLWETGAKITIEAMKESGCYEHTDLFEAMYRGVRAKIHVMRLYPDLGTFTVKAFYETDPEVYADLQKSIAFYSDYRKQKRMLKIDSSLFREDIDLEMMYWDMYWASEGYVWEKLHAGQMNVDDLEKDFMRMIDFWKSVYTKKTTHGNHRQLRRKKEAADAGD